MENCPMDDHPCSNLKKIQLLNPITGEQQDVMACEVCCTGKISADGILKLVDDYLSRNLTTRCPSCGWSADDIMRRTRFGCPSCYGTFKSLSVKMFQKCQTGISHVGKRPEGGAIEASMDFDSQISMLRKKIDKAVAVENYEVASVLKKKIQDLMRTAVK